MSKDKNVLNANFMIKTQSISIRILPDGRMDSVNAASYIGLSQKKTLAVFRCQGKGPKYIKRGKIFSYKEDLDEWINADGKANSTSQLKSYN